MNTQIIEAMAALREAVRTSEEYADYRRCREKVEKDPELLAKVEEYRQREFRYQNILSPEERETERGQLLALMGQLRQNPAADAYFRTERHLCRILQQAAKEVLAPLELHTEGMID